MAEAGGREWIIDAEDPSGELREGMRLKLTAFPAFDGSDDFTQEPYFDGEGTISKITPKADGTSGLSLQVTGIRWRKRGKGEPSR